MYDAKNKKIVEELTYVERDVILCYFKCYNAEMQRNKPMYYSKWKVESRRFLSILESNNLLHYT